MKRAPVTCRIRCLAILAVFCLAACWALPGGSWAVDSAGLIFSIYTDKNQYQPNQRVKLTMVLKKDDTDTQPIITKRGFFDFNNLILHRFLSITIGDPPNTTTYQLGEVPQAHTMDPADYEDEEDGRVVEWRFAETLGDQLPVTETINDLLELTASVVEDASDIQDLSGWFTLRAVISAYVRFDPQQTKTHPLEFIGTLGKIGAEENYTQPIASNTVRFFIRPDQGAQFEIQVLDQGVPAPGVPVKVFRSVQIPPDVEPLELWSGLPEAPPVLTGTTNLSDGTVTQWESGAPCQQADDYTVVAYYGGAFGQTAIYAGDEKWLPSCAGKIDRTILFGEAAPAEKFSLFGLNSVRIGKRAVVLSGDVGATGAASQSKSKSKSKGRRNAVVFIGDRAELRPGTRIYGDSVRIEKKAVVYDVFYNELENKGKILGEKTTPLELPVWEPPVFLESAPGNKDIKVKGKKGKQGKNQRHPVELAAGAYDEVKIEHRGELHLLGGIYHFRRLELKKGTALICQSPTTILIEEDLKSDDKTYIGPEVGTGIGAARIVIHVGGINGKGGKKKRPKVKKVVIGKKSRVSANIYAPHSSLVIERECEAEGSFIAAEIVVGDRTTVAYNGAF